ncbi:hypothetical protein [Nocardiopsis alba]|uniref:hypothetical protein n=1 Tax=Nocardiopsis alba TaxID=53437 RepID=UPI00037ECCFB|nr:hypothetical protein [Nocardiopsis alba]MEC3893712.1 hypothetical protein [Nocardiopsis sp. LDBS1602]
MSTSSPFDHSRPSDTPRKDPVAEKGDTRPVGCVPTLLTFLTCGALAPFTFAYIGLRHRHKGALVGAVCAFPVFLYIGLGDETTVLWKSVAGCYIVITLIASFLLYGALANEGAPKAPASEDDPGNERWRGGIDHESPVDASVRERNERAMRRVAAGVRLRAEARRLLEEDPRAARELGVGRPDLDTGYDDGGLVDLNRAPVEAIADLPGLTHEQALALDRARAAAPFLSLHDALIRADLPPHLEDEIHDHVVF